MVLGSGGITISGGASHDSITLAGTPDYITISGQVLTRTKLDPADDLNTFASSVLAALVTDETGSGLLVFGTSPTLTGGTHTALTGLGIRSTGTGAFDLTLANSENLTAGRTLTITLNDAARTLTISANATVAGTNTGDNAGVTSVTGSAPIASSGGATPAISLNTAGVTLALMADIATARVIGRNTALTGVPESLATLPTGVVPAFTGDVTSPGGSLALTIAADAVTYAKMQNVSATDKVLGRSTAGAGDVEEIAVTAAGRALIDDAAASDQRTTLGLGTIATVNSPVPVANGGTALTALGTGSQVLRTNAGATALEYATLGTGAVTRAGGNTTEATTTSTTSVSLLTTTVSIATGGIPILVRGLVRKATGNALTASVGIMVNTTQLLNNSVWSSSNTTSGAPIWAEFHSQLSLYTDGAAHSAGYLRYGGGNGTGLTITALTTNTAPAATLTSIIITGNVSDAAATMGADEMHVYTYAVS